MKGTIFEKSSTSLHLWFYAAYLTTSTRCGISAKPLEREIGVTYQTAHQMMKKIRTELMSDAGDELLSGDVEIDETAIGGRARKPVGASRQIAIGSDRRQRRYQDPKPKATVLGMVERGGRIRFRVIASRHGAVLSNAVVVNVNPDSIIFTDDWASYKRSGAATSATRSSTSPKASTFAETPTRTRSRARSGT
jgi:transposase